jgi:hypothetical protein
LQQPTRRAKGVDASGAEDETSAGQQAGQVTQVV